MIAGGPPAKFTIIQGGASTASPWMRVPSTVIGRSVLEQDDSAVYRIAQNDARKALLNNRKQPMLDLWSVVLGEIPPFPNAETKWSASAAMLSSIANAHACFRGVKRPVADDKRGFDHFALVSKPTKFFVYEPSMSCNVKLIDVPQDLVHITYIRCDFPEGRRRGVEASLTTSMGSIGVVTHWQFVEADEFSPELPVDYRERYRQRVW